jgi:hypothetical protein
LLRTVNEVRNATKCDVPLQGIFTTASLQGFAAWLDTRLKIIRWKKEGHVQQMSLKSRGLRAAAINFFKNIGQHNDELMSLLDGGFEGLHYT